ncbi:phosphoribosylaminoimidazolesuccinocarboxamide synthase [Gloeothece verrucosa]|uniref:Phosphoribosylaminoimidazole-succinocarboxamide synthase n=1 Tax=Gloeothece verrucosa (strain PCC 7822) TaxID=497965 RepID=E0U9Z3_GLOV7|nr:phosphoribosylaminoimidazolesuccinocarboxamide synthase [Gloeothece verrucosa]ADN16185.1 phosphoribosylaminoimidazole-succinocarboxamide synthase [Gloeothece verrucosa PCC 7822]
MNKLYEGKAKILYSTDEPEIFLAHFKDDATAFNALKRGQIQGKGEINCTISSALFRWLESKGILTHFIEQSTSNEMRVKAVKILPLEVVVRNIAAGSLCRETGLAEGKILPFPLVEFYLKNDELQDPLLTKDRILILEIVTPEQLEEMKNLALKINEHLTQFFADCGITLVDFKLEFGVDSQNKILLADEISPDTCRLWDSSETDPLARVMDKDRFRRDLGKIEEAYQQVQQRVLSQLSQLKS